MMRPGYIAGLAASVILGACGGNNGDTTTGANAADAPPQLHEKLAGISAATYSLERAHAFLSFQVEHGNGISHYRVALTDFDAALEFDPASPDTSQLSVSINPLAVETNYPGDYKAAHPASPYNGWNEDLGRDSSWLDGDVNPTVSFTSTEITLTGDDTGTVKGDLSFRGQTKQVTLNVTFNGGTNVPWFGERDLIGFDAATTLSRSEWGMTKLFPIVGDTVEISFSGEFLQDE